MDDNNLRQNHVEVGIGWSVSSLLLSILECYIQ